MTWLLVFVLFANPRSDANQPVVSQVSVESRELCERALAEAMKQPPAPSCARCVSLSAPAFVADGFCVQVASEKPAPAWPPPAQFEPLQVTPGSGSTRIGPASEVRILLGVDARRR